jgi:hypothetical protein
MSGTSREKYVVISSDDKDAGSISNSNFKVTLKERYATQSIDRIIIRECIVPNAFYNISDGDPIKGNGPINNILLIESSETKTQISVSVPAGQYNILQLMATLQSAINTQIAPLTASVVITRDDITNLLLFTFTTTGIFTFLSISPMAQVLGFSSDISYIPTTLSIRMPDPPDLSGINSVYIHSEALSDGSGIDASKGIINLVESVSMATTAYGTFSYKQNSDTELCTINYTMPRNLNVIDIRLRDREGNLLNIGTKRLTLMVKMYYTV